MIKKIKGYEGYYDITSDGRVYSRKRIVKMKTWRGATERKCGGKWLSLYLSPYGYPTVNLHKRGVVKNHSTHRLVAQHFIPNPQNKPETNHKDGNKLNNNVSNLEWVTRKENGSHASKIGLYRLGEESGRAKLKEKQVKEIRNNHISKGIMKRKPWENYGISHSAYYYIINKTNWNWLKNE